MRGRRATSKSNGQEPSPLETQLAVANRVSRTNQLRARGEWRQARSERDAEGDALEAAALREGEYVGVRRFTRTLERGGDAKARPLQAPFVS